MKRYIVGGTQNVVTRYFSTFESRFAGLNLPTMS